MSGEPFTDSIVSKESKSRPELMIRRPHYLTDFCALKTTTERLPSIENLRKIKKPKKTSFDHKVRPTEEEKSDSDDLRYWLKPGVSLPKLRVQKTGEKTVGKPEAGEPFDDGKLHLPKNIPIKPVSDRFNGQKNPDLEIICFREEKEDVEPDECTGSVGPSNCKLPFRVPSSELSFHDFQMKEDEIEESKALKNWSLWLNRMKSTQENLSKKLNKNNCDLMVNQLYNHRKEIEDKELLTYYKKLKDDAGVPEIFNRIHSSRKKKGTKQVIKNHPVEFIGQSWIAKKEKNLIEMGTSSDREKYKDCFFRRQRNKLDVHKPEMDELAVIGREITSKLPVKNVSMQNVPEIYVTEYMEKNEDRKSIFSLIINGIEIKYEIGSEIKWCSEINEELTWEVSFGLCSVGCLSERTVTVENQGTMAIEYHWVLEKPVLKQSLNTFQVDRHQPWFFFDKNSGVFLPGQKYDLKFYHRANESGVRTETWYLKTSPPLFPDDLGAKFTLITVATSDCRESESVDRYLNKMIRNTIIRTVLDCLVEEAMKPDFGLAPLECRALMSEKDLFEYHNPKYYYHSRVIKDLKDVFFEVSCSAQSEWDLSLDTLLSLVRTCVTQKQRKEFLLRKIFQSAKILFKPPRIFPRKKPKKFLMIHQILCKMADLMVSDFEYQQKFIFLADKKSKCLKGELEERESGELKSESSSKSTVDEMEVLTMKNAVYFQMMTYLKVYERLRESVEAIAGILETSKNLESWESKRTK